jgi:hypothetical protein
MFDPKFERLHLISSFIGHDKGVIIVEENDRRSLYLNMFLKCHHHLHPMTKFEVGYVDQTIDEDYNLHIFNKLLARVS